MVFLASRIREEHVHGLKTREAVEHGIAAIGRVVVAAAIIMATVFSAFILTPERVSKEFGLLLAVAILTDALIVKMTLIPAFFTLHRREDVVHAALAGQDPAEHHDRAAARGRGDGGRPSADPRARALRLGAGRQLERFSQLVRSYARPRASSTLSAMMSPPAGSKWMPSGDRTLTCPPPGLVRYSA